MERNIEREKYYLDTNYRTEVTPDGFKHGDYIYGNIPPN